MLDHEEVKVGVWRDGHTISKAKFCSHFFGFTPCYIFSPS